jgi:hypothetical protein
MQERTKTVFAASAVALALLATSSAVRGSSRTELESPVWAPETVEPVSAGFNAWMDTLPFGESEHHRRMREADMLSPYMDIAWERRHGAARSQVQMLRMQKLAPNIWTDYRIGGDGVKCVCDSAAAGDPEMEGLDPRVKPACTCSGGRQTQFTKTEEGGPLDTGGHGAWPQDLPGASGGGDGAAYIDGIVGNNAYKPVGGATLLATRGGEAYNVYGDDFSTLPSGSRQRAFDAAYDVKSDFQYRGSGLFPEEKAGVAPPMSGLWGRPPVEDTYEWTPSSLSGNGVAARRNAQRKASVQREGTGMGALQNALNQVLLRWDILDFLIR